MKKILYLLALAVFCSCSNGLKNEAQEQMEKTFKEMALDPSSVSISNVKVMFDNDSVCVINLNMSAKNGFGAIRTREYEYVYLIDKADSTQSRREIVLDLSKEEAIMNRARKDYQAKKWNNAYLEKLSDDDKKAYYIYFNAHLYSLFIGRKVGYDKNDIDNW